jgi:hypothetical protein
MQMGVETILAVVVSDKIKSPALFGFVRPRLLLPQGMLETYGLEELRYVFIHELGHLKQRDIYFGWLMALLQVVHWFNPLMWFAFGRMRADREMACDRLVISTMGPDEPPEYGRTIVSLLESFSQVRYLPSVAGILEDTCQMERRIKMIADYKKTPRPKWAGAMLLVAVLACVVLTNAYVAKADYTFGIVTNLGSPVNSAYLDSAPFISTDGLSLYFTSNRPGGEGGADLWVTTRETKGSEWGVPMNLGPPVNSSSHDHCTSISADGLELYFCSMRPGGYGDQDIWMATRDTIDDEWGTPTNLGPNINSSAHEVAPSISPNGLELYFSEYASPYRPGGYGRADIWFSTRPTKDDPWGEPVNLGPTVNSSKFDARPFISTDGLRLFFDSNRASGYGRSDLYVTTRATLSDPWGTPINLGPTVNGSAWEEFAIISADGTTLYFDSEDRPGGLGSYELWQVEILPVVDFNDDGNIDTDDLVILVNCWGTNERLCDIGPTPLGNGIVDMEDLKVFMIYWEVENMPEAPEEEQ